MSSGPASNCGEPAFLSDRELSELVPYDAAIDVLEAALRDGVTGTDDPMRTLVTLRAGQLLLMPSQGPSYAGVKVSAVAPGNPARGLPRIQGTYVLLDAATLTTLAVLDARALTVVRTSATSALSSRYLAVDDAATLVVFGTGPQAEGHVLAHREVRPLRRIGVVGRSPERVAALLRRIDDAGLEGFAAGPQDVAGADIVCACTTAREPLFDGRLLPSHAHVVAIGSHEPDARELDAATLRRAQVVVEDRRAAWREAGDLVLARAEGAIDESAVVADLRELVTGTVPVDRTGLTVFKSVGAAFEDLAVASLAYERRSS